MGQQVYASQIGLKPGKNGIPKEKWPATISYQGNDYAFISVSWDDDHENPIHATYAWNKPNDRVHLLRVVNS